MHFFSIFLHKPSRTLHSRFIFLRYMGGGPRTFPGGLNKWQWKRMHEKKAREKEKRLLEQEKQVYQARIRSEIRAKLVSAENPISSREKPNQNQLDYGPLTPQDHVKALADRFMKEGAEDLWNENDGPLEIPSNKPGKSRFSGDPIDMQRLIAERSSFRIGENTEKSDFSKNVSGNIAKPRHFSTYARRSGNLFGDFGNEYLRTMSYGFGLVASCRRGILMGVSDVLNLKCYYSVGATSTMGKRSNFSRECQKSLIDDDADAKVRSGCGGRVKWPRFRGGEMDSSDDDDTDDHDDDKELESSRKILSSSAALGKYDMKYKKRVPLNFLEDEDDLSQQVEAIRQEVSQRKSMQEDGKEKDEEESILSTKRFDECDVSPLTIRALTEAGYEQMTTVQEATLSACLEGKDALVKARAGTGKSLAFLLPAIETVLKVTSGAIVQRVPPMYVLILCPTRELASQISAEANVLLKHHDSIGVQTLVGGTRFKVDQRRLESGPCQILVATPGRLLDHIENKSGISVRLMGLQMLILDEADHLLDLGFRKDMEKIVDCLPRKRQSLLFSATIPKEVRRISQLVLKRDHAYIDTVGLGCLETNAKQVKQFYLVTPHDQHLQVVYHLLKSHISEVLDYKVIVFCATAMMTSLMCSLFRGMNLNVREIHSKKPPLHRTRISDEFKEARRLILITSDVSARGVNYPDVSLVIQVGIPTDRGQYIHRLGRTGRQGKEGEGVLLLAPWEQYFLDEIKDLPLEKRPSPNLDPDVKLKIEESMENMDPSIKEAAYHAWLGYYNSITAIGRDKTSLVELANQFSASIGLQKPPALYRKTALKMGLKDIPGIRIRK
ncbi:probable DEAD-box ATP-dependent RNA helicase 48 isoform X1 [Sesamum indicum]|uniref:ATP-dependent RNA helicase n=1 Tax=Sesamum indicum TaxID=4182 RepID=A0A6I9T9J7_SESIN|nr:probable DEAD-box ATP-dependent RNA helicase 48 isoform X1 [Sesamum indicum]